MSQTRAFSDSEIITIAAVAASALGGIVIGLGRGQENVSQQSAGTGKLQGARSKAIQAGRAIAQTTPDNIVNDYRSRVTPLAGTVVEAASPVADDLIRRTSNVRSRQVRAPRLKSRRTPSRPVSNEGLRSISKAVESAISGAKSSPARKQALDEFASLGVNIAKNWLAPSGTGEVASSDGPHGVLGRVAEEVASVEEGLAAAPVRVRAAAERGKSVLQERIGDPINSVALSTGSATKDAFAALAWLSASAAIVYFGLLSDQRREQVKATLCGAMEQARLLVLDFQGYEPEL